jgi:hypothetical protein
MEHFNQQDVDYYSSSINMGYLTVNRQKSPGCCLLDKLPKTDVYSLKELMGHSDLQVLQRYLKQTNEDLEYVHRKASPLDNSDLYRVGGGG